MGLIDPELFSIIKKTLSSADIQINGARPWDLKINNSDIFERVVRDGTLGIGEGYMDGWWDCESLDGLIYRILKNDLDKIQPASMYDIIKLVSVGMYYLKLKTNIAFLPILSKSLLKILSIKLFNFQTKKLAEETNQIHYNFGNDLFERMLGPHMQYSFGYWKNATTFEESEENKVRLICEKLQLEPGMRVLDIGCGFGGLAKYMAQNYGVSVTGITASSEHRKYAEQFCEGLNVTIELKDYRDLDGKFDRIVTVEMMEHVGPKNLATFFSVIDRCLSEDGLFLLHTVGSKDLMEKHEDWLDTYILPNVFFPSLKQIAVASERYFFVEDVHNFGTDYDKTAMAWYERFLDAWPHFSHKYDERFKRMFCLYLTMLAGSSRSRRLQAWHIVFSRGRESAVCVPR